MDKMVRIGKRALKCIDDCQPPKGWSIGVLSSHGFFGDRRGAIATVEPTDMRGLATACPGCNLGDIDLDFQAKTKTKGRSQVQTCRLATHNQYFPTLHATVLAVEDLFTPWHSGSETLRKIMRNNLGRYV